LRKLPTIRKRIVIKEIYNQNYGITMRYFLLVILSVTFHFYISAQTDVKKMHLYGNVKSIKEISYRAQKSGNEIQKGSRERAYEGAEGTDIEICFNKQQYKTNETHFASDGSVSDYLTLFYDGKMNKTKWYCYSSDSTFKWGYNYYYNDLNLESSSIGLDKNKKQHERKVYTYNSEGLLVTEETYFEDGYSNIESIEYDMYKRVIQKRSSTGEYETFNYESNRKIWTIFNAANDTLCQTIFEYDQNENILKTCSRDITLRYTNQVKSDYCVLNTYDLHGNKISEQWMDSKISRPKETFEYVYDEKGNWIKKIHFIHSKAKYIIIRDIKYY
jgi:hypothetical protein